MLKQNKDFKRVLSAAEHERMYELVKMQDSEVILTPREEEELL